MVRASASGRATLAAWSDVLGAIPGSSLSNVARGMVSFDLRDRLRQIQAPTLVIAGEQLDEVLQYLGLGDRQGLGSRHRAQDLQSFLMNRVAVGLLRENPTLVSHVEGTLSRWRQQDDQHTESLLDRWAEIVAARDWNAALANTADSQQLRQSSPLAGLLPNETRFAIMRYVRELKLLA